MSLGKLKSTLKERCPVCGKVLEIRVVEKEVVVEGFPFLLGEEYIRCSNKNCDYRKKNLNNKRRFQGIRIPEGG